MVFELSQEGAQLSVTLSCDNGESAGVLSHGLQVNTGARHGLLAASMLFGVTLLRVRLWSATYLHQICKET